MPAHGYFPVSSLLPRLPRGLPRLPFCKALADLTGALDTGPSQDGGLGYLKTPSCSAQVHGVNEHCLAGLLVEVGAKTFMKSAQEDRQSLCFTGSVLGMLLLFFLSSVDSARISLLTPIRSHALPCPYLGRQCVS